MVYTGDGRLYSFRLRYNEAPVRTVLPVAELFPLSIPGSPAVADQSVTGKPNEAQVKDWVSLVKKQSRFISAAKRKAKMKLKLLGIYYVGELVFLDLLISNKSSLPYTIDFVRAYIQDKEQVKRSSIQQREIKPVFQDDELTIGGKSNYRYTLVIPRFTLDDNKQFLVELFEQNGGRNVSLPIKNKHLFSAKEIKHGD